MKHIIPLFVLVLLFACNTTKTIDIKKYHQLINQAEVAICKDKLDKADDLYNSAFAKIEKPFGKDLFNAALVNAKLSQKNDMKEYLQTLVNNLGEDDTYIIYENFVGKHINKEEWKTLQANREIDYDEDLRRESVYILERDKWHRPNYDTHDDTIQLVALENLDRIVELSEIFGGLPAQYELGYPDNLKGHDYHLVLHHLAQKRSLDKSFPDLEKLLFKAVQTGRLAPERAIVYMKYQNDMEKGWFRIAEITQHVHRFLNQEQQDKIWMTKLSASESANANQLREKWLAAPIEDAIRKSYYKAIRNEAFIFTAAQKSIGHFSEGFTKEEVMEQYRLATLGYEELKFDLKN